MRGSDREADALTGVPDSGKCGARSVMASALPGRWRVRLDLRRDAGCCHRALHRHTAPPTAGGTATLDYIAAHRTLYIVHQQLWLVPGVFAMVTYLAIYPALRHMDGSIAALGAAVGGSAWALTLAIPTTSTGAPALVYLSDQFTATADPARRAALTAAAETLIAQNRTPGAVGVLTTVGLLIVSMVMLKGVFPRAVAYLGIATGVLGIASEALRPVIEGGYAVYGVLLLVWMGAVGWRLLRLGRRSGPVPVVQPAPSPLGADAAGKGVR
jgi:Domain of unknown function (DUF4386)